MSNQTSQLLWQAQPCIGPWGQYKANACHDNYNLQEFAGPNWATLSNQ